MKNFILFLIFFHPAFLEGQNLVPNSGFDIYTSCPGNVQDRLYLAFPWYNPSTGSSTPDFYHTCSPTGAIMAIPNNITGYQFGHSLGGGYAGCVTFVANNTTPNSREYAQVELLDSLMDSSYYCISFFVSKVNNAGIANSDIGLYISDTAYFLTSNMVMPVQPQIFNPDSNIISDTLNWVEISGIYQAHGGERYITIGNFKDSANSHAAITDTAAWNLNARFAYYLIDDVSVINCDSLFSIVKQVLTEKDVRIYPNPCTYNLNIVLNSFYQSNAKLKLYSLQGQLLLTKPFQSEIDVSDLPKGIYMLEVITEKGSVVKKVVKQ